MSELRLYCDLLVQQVAKTKEASAAGGPSPQVSMSISQGTSSIPWPVFIFPASLATFQGLSFWSASNSISQNEEMLCAPVCESTCFSILESIPNKFIHQN